MSKAIKTPSIENVNYANNNLETAIKTFVSVVDTKQYVVEAENAEEAQTKIEEEIRKNS